MKPFGFHPEARTELHKSTLYVEEFATKERAKMPRR